MIHTTVPHLNQLPAGTVIYDRDFETYLKREDGAWAYPARNPTLSSITAQTMLRHGPFQTLEKPVHTLEPVTSLEDLRALPSDSVVSGLYLAQKRTNMRGEFWQVAGFASPWPTDYLARRERFPLRLLREGLR